MTNHSDGEEHGPSTLAAESYAISSSASRRGEPSPELPTEEEIAKALAYEAHISSLCAIPNWDGLSEGRREALLRQARAVLALLRSHQTESKWVQGIDYGYGTGSGPDETIRDNPEAAEAHGMQKQIAEGLQRELVMGKEAAKHELENRRLREALELYACDGLENCPVVKLKDGSCIHVGTGHCGDVAFRALSTQADPSQTSAMGMESK